MTLRKRAFIFTSVPTAPVLVLVTGMYDPYRWGVYFNKWRDVVPVSFYGQVVDDDGNPVQGAEVVLRIHTWNWAFILGAKNPGTDKIYAVSTDAAGKFQLIDKSGSSLEIRGIKKTEYRFNPRRRDGGYDTAFDYAWWGNPPYKSDPSNPHIFHLTKSDDKTRSVPKLRRNGS